MRVIFSFRRGYYLLNVILCSSDPRHNKDNKIRVVMVSEGKFLCVIVLFSRARQNVGEIRRILGHRFYFMMIKYIQASSEITE